MKSKIEVSGAILFNEVQHFRVKWLWILLVSIITLSVFLPFILALAGGTGLKEALLSLLITVPIEGTVLYLFYVVNLETVVSSGGIHFRWKPFFRRYNFIARNDIETFFVDDGPVLSYGFHFVIGYGWVHNTGPGKGIMFHLIGGKRIFIGTHDIDSLESAVNKMIKGQH